VAPDMRIFARAHRNNVAKLTPIIGADAARMVVVADEWLAVMLVVLVFVAIPTSLWASNGGPRLPAGLAWLAGLSAGGVSLALSRQVDRLASAAVSSRLGHRVTLRGGGTSASRWSRRIERASIETMHSG